MSENIFNYETAKLLRAGDGANTNPCEPVQPPEPEGTGTVWDTSIGYVEHGLATWLDADGEVDWDDYQSAYRIREWDGFSDKTNTVGSNFSGLPFDNMGGGKSNSAVMYSDSVSVGIAPYDGTVYRVDIPYKYRIINPNIPHTNPTPSAQADSYEIVEAYSNAGQSLNEYNKLGFSNWKTWCQWFDLSALDGKVFNIPHIIIVSDEKKYGKNNDSYLVTVMSGSRQSRFYPEKKKVKRGEIVMGSGNMFVSVGSMIDNYLAFLGNAGRVLTAPETWRDITDYKASDLFGVPDEITYGDDARLMTASNMGSYLNILNIYDKDMFAREHNGVFDELVLMPNKRPEDFSVRALPFPTTPQPYRQTDSGRFVNGSNLSNIPMIDAWGNTIPSSASAPSSLWLSMYSPVRNYPIKSVGKTVVAQGMPRDAGVAYYNCNGYMENAGIPNSSMFAGGSFDDTDKSMPSLESGQFITSPRITGGVLVSVLEFDNEITSAEEFLQHQNTTDYMGGNTYNGNHPPCYHSYTNRVGLRLQADALPYRMDYGTSTRFVFRGDKRQDFDETPKTPGESNELDYFGGYITEQDINDNVGGYFFNLLGYPSAEYVTTLNVNGITTLNYDDYINRVFTTEDGYNNRVHLAGFGVAPPIRPVENTTGASKFYTTMSIIPFVTPTEARPIRETSVISYLPYQSINRNTGYPGYSGYRKYVDELRTIKSASQFYYVTASIKAVEGLDWFQSTFSNMRILRPIEQINDGSAGELATLTGIVPSARSTVYVTGARYVKPKKPKDDDDSVVATLLNGTLSDPMGWIMGAKQLNRRL